MTHQAYQNTQRITESPRDNEYRLFGQVTGALIDARDGGVKVAGRKGPGQFGVVADGPQ